ncbi:MAG: restriction endonuclease [Kofleriaceae bacterium]
MAKKKTDGTEASDKKKPAAKKSAPAKKSTAPAKKPAAKKPARAKKDTQVEQIAAEAVEVLDEGEALNDVIEAEVVAETPAEVIEAPVELTPEEQELTAIYGEDTTGASAAHAEFTDGKTRDEDRPMMPEINARDERRAQWQDRRDRRKQRRDERQQRREERQSQGGQQQHGGGNNGHQQQRHEQQRFGFNQNQNQNQHQNQPRESRPNMQAPIVPVTPITIEHDALARVGTPLGDAAAAVFAQLRNGQPLPVRQLAAMMRKRNLVNQDPEQLWPQLKAELIGDERSYRTLGLRPRIVYRGRDLFAPGPVAMSTTADAEGAVASALSKLAGATHRALSQRVARASAAGFERLIHGYLVAAGYREIEWVKRVGGIAYATAIAPGLGRTVLISARSGDQPIDRRGIGELRVGVEAKDLVAGILFAAKELSEDAEQELERAGRSISVMCGDSLVAALIAAGVGVVSAAAPVHYLDDQLLDELLAG